MTAMDEQEIAGLTKNFVATDARNAVPEIAGLTIFEEPLVAIASAGDPIYGQLKEVGIIGPHHLSPDEWLPGARSVVVYFLPFTREITDSNKPDGMPSKEWYLSYHWGEAFNNALRDHLAGVLMRAGRAAVAPMRDERFVMLPDTSNWSERHTAYIASMGTFSLSYSFITKRGCAGRFGSVITDLSLDPTPRTATSLRGNCLFEGDGGCGDCIARCP